MKASIVAMTFLLAGAPALAQPPEVLPPTAATAGDPAETAAVAPETAPIEQTSTHMQVADAQAEADSALSLEELEELRGGEAIVIQYTTQTLTAVNSGNSVNGDTIGSGAVNLGSGAFNGYDGIGNFVINTGHNNNLQGSISVSIAMTPQ
jgi:hypothetical protein